MFFVWAAICLLFGLVAVGFLITYFSVRILASRLNSLGRWEVK